MNVPTSYVDDIAIAIRMSELPNASFTTGMNGGASNAPGIGINVGGGAVIGTADQFTLLDQAGAARTPQDSQQFSGVAQPIDAVTPSTNGDGSWTVTGEATLSTLSAGWTSVAA
jgi:hypothetical protein|tara:strand:+ start:648 stop:989 length:342 start_codon:yes stop_codon:yes gene_type:complete